ncbi:hypothetical protein cyc_02720 [Cyclospora cayetanensis]|uniref:Thrombospondin type 1 domain-containing protein n=1 Tax=Cyclospora cayetanensis TaxID=88456 RepID=A0A1D3CY86_9EIME|nr:hypothetical protein cyc_02720 [Cyclospora cayetanensis]
MSIQLVGALGPLRRPLRIRESRAEASEGGCLLSEWSAWSGCSSCSAGGTPEVRHREVLVPGAPCPLRMESRPCVCNAAAGGIAVPAASASGEAAPDCPEGEWGEWGPCGAGCVRYRLRLLPKTAADTSVSFCARRMEEAACETPCGGGASALTAQFLRGGDRSGENEDSEAASRVVLLRGILLGMLVTTVVILLFIVLKRKESVKLCACSCR